MTTPLPYWSDAIAAMIRTVSGSEPLFALFAEQAAGTVIVGIAQSPTSDGLVLITADVEDDMTSLTLDRATVQQIADALNRWLS